MNSLHAIQARNGLWQLLWQTALSEAYTAKDAQRRMQEIAGLSRDEVVDAYFRYHPELRQWAESHIAAGTCEQAITELEAERKVIEEKRAQGRQRAQRLARMTPDELCEPPRADAPDWMKPFMRGPVRVGLIEEILQGDDAQPPQTEAQTPPIEREKPPEQGKRRCRQEDFDAWVDATKEQGRRVTSRLAEEWAKQEGYSTTSVRKLYATLGANVGRPMKNAPVNAPE